MSLDLPGLFQFGENWYTQCATTFMEKHDDVEPLGFTDDLMHLQSL